MFYLASAAQDFHTKYWLSFLMGPGSLQQEAVSTGCPQPVHPARLLVACGHGPWQLSPALPRGSRGVPAPVGSTGQARPGAHGLGWAEGHSTSYTLGASQTEQCWGTRRELGSQSMTDLSYQCFSCLSPHQRLGIVTRLVLIQVEFVWIFFFYFFFFW